MWRSAHEPGSEAQRARYPRNWKAISRWAIARAGHRCETCGTEQGKPNPVTGSKVRLGAAHLDHRPENVSAANLRAWCQRCHLIYGLRYHLAKIKENRRARRAAQPLPDLIALMLGRPPRKVC